MKHHFKLSPRVRGIFELFLSTVIFFTLWRGVFYLAFYKKAESFLPTEIGKAFFIGLRFDIRVALVLILPLLVFSLIRKTYWGSREWARRWWTIAYTAIYFFVAFAYVLDLGHYAYLESRASSAVFQNLKNPLISAQMVWQSYNVLAWSVFFLVFIFALYQYFQHRIFRPETSGVARPKAVLISQSAAFILAVLLGLHGSLGQYPLRWSQAFFTQNIFVASLAMNPIHYLVDTAGRSKKNFNRERVQKYYPVISRYLNVTSPDVEKLNFQRPLELGISPSIRRAFKLTDEQLIQRPPNVVYIVMESMAAYKTGAFGNGANASPVFDQLTRQGWLFKNFYTPTEGTARSLFCILSGVPDIDAKSTSSRNPLIINQHTLINGLKDHSKFYFIGGSAAWGNIRGVYMNNVMGLEMYEQDRLGGSTTDVWGLSDLDLFRRTAKILNEQDPAKPFFALIQSASFHRPYTVPDDAGDFQKLDLSEEELKKYGFASNEEYNSFRFSDYSLGEFFRLIQDSPFFANTLFIIHGDHGLPHYGATNVGDGYKHFGLNRFHTPLLFYSPLFKGKKVFDMMVTEPDVMPTVLGLLNRPYINTALGHNVLAIDQGQPRYAFSYVYYSNPLQIMLYDQNFLAFGNEKQIQSLHEYTGPDPKRDVKDLHPEKFRQMESLLLGIFETSKFILHNNPKLPYFAVDN